MPNTNLSEEDFRSLVNRLLDDPMGGNKQERLSEQLIEAMQANESYREIYVEMTQLHASLSWPRRWSPNQTIPRTEPKEHVEEQPASNGSWRWIVALVLAAMILFAVLTPLALQEKNLSNDSLANSTKALQRKEITQTASDSYASFDPSLVAVAGRTVSVDWTLGSPIETGQTLRRGWIGFASGIVQLDFFSGARLVVRGPAKLELRSSSEVKILSGEAACYVSELGRGFRILTGESEVVDLGTSFGIRVQPGTSPEVHVFEGKVSVKQNASSDTVEVEQKHAVRIDPAKLSDVAFSESQFPNYDILQEEQLDESQVKYERWKNETARLSTDPSLLLHYTFENQKDGDIQVINQAQTRAVGSAGSIIGAQWQPGRWPMKAALAFKNENDRVLAKVEGSYQTLTLMMWARIDAIPGPRSTLLLTEKPKRWVLNGTLSPEVLEEATTRRANSAVQETRWMIDQEAKANLNIALVGSKNNPLAWDQYMTENPVVGPSEWGNWSALAVTYDTVKNQVVHYVNGELVDAQPLKKSLPILLDYLEIGNLSTWENEQEQGVNFRFYGAIDEIIIADRVFTAKEIQEIYEVGKP